MSPNETVIAAETLHTILQGSADEVKALVRSTGAGKDLIPATMSPRMDFFGSDVRTRLDGVANRH